MPAAGHPCYRLMASLVGNPHCHLNTSHRHIFGEWVFLAAIDHNRHPSSVVSLSKVKIMSNFPINHRRAGSIIIGLVMVLALSACVPVVFSYRYFSLADYPDAKALEKAEADPGNGNWFMGEVTTRYRITRPDYTLILKINPRAQIPDIRFIFEPIGQYRIQYNNQGNYRKEPCIGWHDPGASAEWSADLQCLDVPDQTPLTLYFSITDRKGNFVAEETIPVTVVKQGYFYVIDTI